MCRSCRQTTTTLADHLHQRLGLVVVVHVEERVVQVAEGGLVDRQVILLQRNKINDMLEVTRKCFQHFIHFLLKCQKKMPSKREPRAAATVPRASMRVRSTTEGTGNKRK